MKKQFTLVASVLFIQLLCSRNLLAEERSGNSVDDEMARIEERYNAASDAKHLEKRNRVPAATMIRETPAPASTQVQETKETHHTVEADKSQYNLFNPTPRSQMRDFDSDRPGFTDSPKTLDAGHFQLEMGMLGYTRHRTDETEAATGDVTTTRKKTFTTGDIALGIGLLDSVELQLTFGGVQKQNTTIDGTTNAGTTALSGSGNMGTRVKWNILGNAEGSPVSIALLPAVRYAASTSNTVASHNLEGGFAVPIAVELPSDWSLRFMPEWERKMNEAATTYQNEFSTGVVMGHTLIGHLGGYGQFQEVSTDSATEGTAVKAGFGFIYKALPDLQLDAGSAFGLTKAADKVNFSTGIVYRY